MYSLNKFIGFLTLATIIIATSACSRKGGESRTTGWSYNDREMGGFEVAEYIEQETGPGLVLIEGGTFVMGATLDRVVYNTDNYARRQTIRSFYMDMTEVTNVDYREYLYWLRRVFQSFPDAYRNALPDTLVWRSRLAYNEPLVENYFRHPAYQDYPVVGVSWVQASDYAKWRTDRVNELRMYERGILALDSLINQVDEDNFNTEAYLVGQYDGFEGRKPMPDLNPMVDDTTTRRVRMEDGILLPSYRLPTEAEWEYAALGLIENTQYERISQRKTYPWNGNYVRTADKNYYGGFVANFKRGAGDYMGVAGALNDGADIPTEVGSYFPNDYGLYNMGGNVSEWVMDVYRPSSLDDIDDYQGFRGNVFQTKETKPDGSLEEKDALGRIKYRNVTIDEADGRKNYRKANNINYLDGDYSTVLPEDGSKQEWIDDDPNQSTTKLMYDYGSSSMISDDVRVYKGGSWKDPAYYLSPSVRRFLQQDQSTNFIGFRCAMDRVGSPMSGGR